MEYTDIKLHQAKIVSAWNGLIFNPEAVQLVKQDYIVRISLYISKTSRFNDWIYDFDSPYIKIVEIINNEDGEELLLGEVQKQYRTDDDFKYPVRTGDRIWFKREHIIEIPIEWQSDDEKLLLNPLLTKKYISVTGPLYTISDAGISSDEEDSNSNTSDSDSDSDSDSESDEE
jgi:hypothetical protein